MNTPLKHTLLAMATAALGFTAACGGGDAPKEPVADEATTGGEASSEAADDDKASEASCGGEGSCGEGSCGEGACG